MPHLPADIASILRDTANEYGLRVLRGHVRRTSSRFCLGVEHGDYNGTNLFGVGTDRFIWIAYQANQLGKIRIASANFPDDGLVEFELGNFPKRETDSWARFPYGANAILQREGFALTTGVDAVIYGNIPGGGMSRSASLTLNLLMTLLEVNDVTNVDGMRIVKLAQAVENDYIGSPCGNLDQIMIYFAKAHHGVLYRPKDATVEHVPLSGDADDFCLVSLDTGTERHGLEKSTYKIRRDECNQLVALTSEKFGIEHLADICSPELLRHVLVEFSVTHPHLCRRLKYIYESQQRFDEMIDAWKRGDIRKVGSIFRMDGFGLRDDYEISGPELEAMCEIARTVDGVLGERMLGGGDKGSSGAIVLASAVDDLHKAVDEGYPRRFPQLANRFAVHTCRTVDGVAKLDWPTTVS